MTAQPKDPAGLLDAIVSAVRVELDRVLVPTDAPLVAPDSERWLLAAVLSGRVTHDALPPLDGPSFGVRAWGVLWDASHQTLDPVALHMAVTAAGYPSVSTDIAEMCTYDGPLPSLPDLAGICTKIRDYWARRTLHRELVACARLLAAEAITVLDAIERLRAAVKEVRR